MGFTTGIRTRTASLVVGVALLGGATLVAPAGAVTPPPVNGVGTVTCSVKATLKFSPALRYPGTVQPTTITLVSNLTLCSGTGDGARIKSGKSTVITTADTNDCITLLNSGQAGNGTGDIKWTILPHTSPKLLNSTVTFTSTSVNPGPPSITNDSSGSTTAGSFNGDPAAAHSVLKQTFAQLSKSCTTNGLSTITIISPGSTFTLSSAPA